MSDHDEQDDEMTTPERVIPGTITVNETIHRYPATVEVFNVFGIDACCGGAASIVDAAERDGVKLSALLEALERVAGGEP